jgi:hypothetical protein
VLLGLTLATLASGCAGSVAPREPALGKLASDHPTRGPGAVFATIEEAALDALAWSRANGRLTDRRRLRIGTIQRRPGGYAYSAPLRSRTTVDSSAPLNVRFRLESEDVATFVLHPRSGRRSVDRRNESATPDERRLVDELDPRHRPIFVLTPSRKVIRYRNGELPILVVQRESHGTRLPSPPRPQ